LESSESSQKFKKGVLDMKTKNAVTHQAHTAPDYDRCVELEAMGGKLLNLASTEWKRVLEAA